MNPNFILLAIPVFLLSILGELLHNFFKKGGKDFNFDDSITHLNIGIGNQAVGGCLFQKSGNGLASPLKRFI
jgi:hypothetical protein